MKLIQWGTLITTIVAGGAVAAESHSRDGLLKILKSEKMVGQYVNVDGKSKNVVMYHRQPSGDYKKLPNTDYLYFWHGKEQDVYSFVNLSGVVAPKVDDYASLFLIGVDMTDFSYGGFSANGRLVQTVASQFKPLKPMRKSHSIGYDLGAANAYSFGCEFKTDTIVMVAGGISTLEDCSPKGASVLYVYLEGDNLFPYNKETAFIDNNYYSLDYRLDAMSTIETLRDLLGCAAPSLDRNSVEGSSIKTWSCNDGNVLNVVDIESNNHQWPGYINAHAGTFNQYGTSINPSVMDLSSDILKLR